MQVNDIKHELKVEENQANHNNAWFLLSTAEHVDCQVVFIIIKVWHGRDIIKYNSSMCVLMWAW